MRTLLTSVGIILALAGCKDGNTPPLMGTFRESQDGPFLTGFLQVVPNQPWVLGAGDSGLVEVDVRNNAVLRAWPDTVHSADCTWGVGPSVRPGHYVLFGKTPGGGCSHPWIWHYGPQLTRVDSVPGRPDEWSFAEIGPGGTIAGSDDNLWISQCDVGGCPSGQTYLSRAGSLTGVSIASTAQRAILNSFFGWVVDAAHGDTLARLSSSGTSYHVEGAAFSANEDTAYVVTSGPSRVLRVNTAQGLVHDSVPLSGVVAFDIARDPARPWLYVAAFEGALSAVPQLIILDQATLAPRATLRAPPTAGLDLTQWHQFRIVQDPAMRAIYVVATVQAYDLHGVRSRILRFDVEP